MHCKSFGTFSGNKTVKAAAATEGNSGLMPNSKFRSQKINLKHSYWEILIKFTKKSIDVKSKQKKNNIKKQLRFRNLSNFCYAFIYYIMH